MAYSQVSAANVGQLIDAIVTFATANGWVLEYDVNDTTDGKQIGLTSSVCKVAIGEKPGNPVAINAGWGNDTRICMALTTVFGAGRNYWSHGGIVDGPNSANVVMVNDVTGPMTAVHLFGDSRSVFVAVKSTATRWTTFGFGMLDRAGGDVAFCGGEYYAFWFDVHGGTSQVIEFASRTFHGGVNVYGASGLAVLSPAGILDSSFGFPADVTHVTYNDGLQLPLVMHSPNPAYGSDRALSGILEPVWETTPTLTTGGMALLTVPVIAVAKVTGNLTFLGELPTVRLCRAPTVTPGELVTYGDDEYMVFPMKQKGAASDTKWGGVDNGQPNSLDFCYAMKKA